MNNQPVRKDKIKAVLLVGDRDFGRCRLASRMNPALWPIGGKTCLQHLLIHLEKQGIKRITICCNGNASLLQKSIGTYGDIELLFLEESLPAGTAGCIRRAFNIVTDDLLLIIQAGIIMPPDIDELINKHKSGQSDLTLAFNPNGELAGIYICDTKILEHIPKDGYFDIKESLIPELLRSGKSIHAVTLSKPVGNFRNREEYLLAIAQYLDNGLPAGLKIQKQTGLWAGANVNIDSSAKLYGPIAIMDGACVSKDTVVIGPAIIGRNVKIGRGSVIVNSVLWDGAQIGPDCRVTRCVLDYNIALAQNSTIEEESIPLREERLSGKFAGAISAHISNMTISLCATLAACRQRINARLPRWAQSLSPKVLQYVATGFILIAFFWSYRSDFTELWDTWQRSDEYSSGLLVPFLTVYVLWSRRKDIVKYKFNPSLWGVLVFILAQAFRLFGLVFGYSAAENLSIALTVWALVLLLFGVQIFRKVFTLLLFLCLMLPWPHSVQASLALPLQRWATSSAVFCLEMMGFGVTHEGNIIHIGDASVGVAEACNGLRMITAFFVISGLVVLLIKRTWWEKLVVLVSSLPIALLCNTTRLTITAIAFTMINGDYWKEMFHDFGGYAMMPLALMVVIAELWILAKLTIPPAQQESLIIRRQR